MSASVNLALHHKVQKFSSGTGSPGWSRKKGRKTVVVWWWFFVYLFRKVLSQGAMRACAKENVTLVLFCCERIMQV